MLRGSASAKVDDKGRIKLPSMFRAVIEPTWGNRFFVTSVRGDSVLLYPMEIFETVEERLRSASGVRRLIVRYRNALNFHGQTASMDAQGRILIHPILRETASVNGDVTVLGQQDHLEVWNRARFDAEHRPLDDDELDSLADFGF